jgi:hypothetical protein
MIKTKCYILFRLEAAIVVDVAGGDDEAGDEEIGDGEFGDEDVGEVSCVHANRQSPLASTISTIIVTAILGVLFIGSLLSG